MPSSATDWRRHEHDELWCVFAVGYSSCGRLKWRLKDCTVRRYAPSLYALLALSCCCRCLLTSSTSSSRSSVQWVLSSFCRHHHCTRIQDDQFIVCLGGVNPLSFPSPPLPSLSSTFYPFVAKQLPLSLLHGPSQLRNLEERSSPLPCSESAERILGYILFNSKFPHLMRLITTHLAGEACWKNIRK